MLALTDQALARLCVAATAVPQKKRAQWLRRVARKLEPLPRARHTAAWRAREKAGRILLKLEVDEAELVVGLIDAGLLDPLVADDRCAITAAAQRALVQFCCNNGETSPRAQRVYDTMRIRLVLLALKRELRVASRRRLRRST
jgi:hypothetical protein